MSDLLRPGAGGGSATLRSHGHVRHVLATVHHLPGVSRHRRGQDSSFFTGQATAMTTIIIQFTSTWLQLHVVSVVIEETLF